jgi:hypothetical protein
MKTTVAKGEQRDWATKRAKKGSKKPRDSAGNQETGCGGEISYPNQAKERRSQEKQKSGNK